MSNTNPRPIATWLPNLVRGVLWIVNFKLLSIENASSILTALSGLAGSGAKLF
jgi:hypothetical protein